MKEPATEAWAFEEFGQAKVGDHRWRKRLVRMAATVARRPAGRVTEAVTNDAERQGAYGLLNEEEVSHEAVGQAMFEASARRSASEEYVFCAVDGTSLGLADPHRCKGFGPIGVRSKQGRGLKVMNAMVLSAHGVPLGISSQRWWVRPERRRRKHRDSLRPEQKETHHWLQAMKQTSEVMAAHAPNTRCWFQLDREGDAWPLLTAASEQGAWFTIRSARNRRVLLGPEKTVLLRDVLRAEEVKAEYSLEVRAAAGRQARVATMVIRACKVTLSLRDKSTNRRFPFEVHVVQALEVGTTPTGEKPIEWTLLTNRSIKTVAQMTDVIRGYSMRWRIEELHRTWKSGGCRVEETQLRSFDSVVKWATILIAVSVRIERIKQLSRDQPALPASEEFSPVEIRAAKILYFAENSKAKPPSAPPTIAEVTFWIAKIGGFTGTATSRTLPGSITIARGLQQIRVAARTISALEK